MSGRATRSEKRVTRAFLSPADTVHARLTWTLGVFSVSLSSPSDVSTMLVATIIKAINCTNTRARCCCCCCCTCYTQAYLCVYIHRIHYTYNIYLVFYIISVCVLGVPPGGGLIQNNFTTHHMAHTQSAAYHIHSEPRHQHGWTWYHS